MDHRHLDMAIELADAPLKQMMLVAVAAVIGENTAAELKLEDVFDCAARQAALCVGEQEYLLVGDEPLVTNVRHPDEVYKVFDESITLLSPVVEGVLNAWLARHGFAVDLTIHRDAARWSIGGTNMWLDARPVKKQE